MIHRVLLSEENFRSLVAGAVITVKPVQKSSDTIEIALSDIGYSLMLSIIVDQAAALQRRTLIQR